MPLANVTTQVLSIAFKSVYTFIIGMIPPSYAVLGVKAVKDSNGYISSWDIVPNSPGIYYGWILATISPTNTGGLLVRVWPTTSRGYDFVISPTSKKKRTMEDGTPKTWEEF